MLRTAVRRLSRAIGRLVASRAAEPRPAPSGTPSPTPAEAHVLEMLPWSLALTEVVE